MKRRKRFLKIILIFVLFGLVLSGTFSTVKADNGSASFTWTIDTEGNYIPTQDAYLAMKMVTSFSLIGDSETTISLKAPEDIYYQEDLKVFVIADTGNSRILITDSNMRNAQIIAPLDEAGKKILGTPQGVYMNSEGKIYIADYEKQTVFVLTPTIAFDLTNPLMTNSFTVTRIDKPNHPLYGESVQFKPTKIAVDNAGMMYIIDAGNANGIVTITNEGNFSGYFGANYVTPTLSYIIKFIFATDEQKAQLYRSPISPTNLTIDYDGLINTVTTGLTGNALKKLNITGTNLFPDEMMGVTDSLSDICIGPTGTIYCVDSYGYIREYDQEGNLLFSLGGRDTSGKYIGLYTSPKSIEVDDDYHIYVLDNNYIQILIPTDFSAYIHEALYLYNKGLYEESREPWEEVLKLNNMFDLAHKGLGNAYLREEKYDLALEQFKIAKDTEGYSDAYWEVRNDWIISYLPIIVIAILLVVIIFFILNKLKLLEKPKLVMANVKSSLKEKKYLNEFCYLFTFVKHPLNGYDGIKRGKKMSPFVSTIWYVILFVIIILQNIYTGFTFNTKDIESISIFQIFTTTMVPILLFVLANHMISSIRDGNGKFRDVYTGTICAFSPYIIFMPLVILVSNVLTLNEEFIVTASTWIIYIWVFFMVFFMIKDIQDYQVGENIGNILLTVVAMLLFVAFAFLLYVLTAQLYSFIKDIILEVISNG